MIFYCLFLRVNALLNSRTEDSVSSTKIFYDLMRTYDKNIRKVQNSAIMFSFSKGEYKFPRDGLKLKNSQNLIAEWV